MNVQRSSHPLQPMISKLSSIRWLVPLVVLPLIGFAIYAGWLGYREQQSSRDLDALIAPIRAAGEPLGDAWLAQRFRQTSSNEGTAAWSEIEMLSGNIGWRAMDKLPIVGVGKTLRTLEVGAKWEADALVDDFLLQAQPLLELIFDAAKYPTPVWQPLVFRGLQTLLPQLQESRQVQRLLMLDFEHAIVHQDLDRAMRDLQAMQTTAAAFDWHICIVNELVTIALRGMYYDAIERSLFAQVWTDEHLEKLMEQVRQPLPLERGWAASIEAEKAMTLSNLDGTGSMADLELLNSASNKLYLIRRYDEIQSLADTPAGQFARKAAQLESDWKNRPSNVGGDILVNMLTPAVAAYAEAFDRSERSRRLVLTSLAVKRFQLANDRWPEQLQELSQVGLGPADWTLPGIGSLGYAVESDGKTACVWAVGPKDKQGIQYVVASQCPDYAGEKLFDVQYYLTVIK